MKFEKFKNLCTYVDQELEDEEALTLESELYKNLELFKYYRELRQLDQDLKKIFNIQANVPQPYAQIDF